jgi:1-phosphofructokinase
MSPNPDIVTVTLNPAIDETVFLDELHPGAVNRSQSHHRQAAGKGVNISSMLAQYGIPSIATGFLGCQNPGIFENLFHDLEIQDEFLRIGGETRSGIKIISTAKRETTDINFPGAAPDSGDLGALQDKLRGLLRPGRWFVLAGSLPAGVSVEYFEGLIKLLKRGGASIAVDCHGPALKSAIACGVDLIKPNHHELAGILDELPTGVSEVHKAAVGIQRNKVAHVIVSLGKDGALFALPDGFFKTSPPPVRVISTVGAGDSMLAGYLAGRLSGYPATECAALASVFSWSALEDVSRQLPGAGEIAIRMKRILVESLNYS